MKNYKKMLENAGHIQYLLNVLEDSYKYLILTRDEAIERGWLQSRRYKNRASKYLLIALNDEDGSISLHNLEESEYRFLLKGRTLRSGLATPMARYYAWKALNRKEDGSNE